MSLADLKQKQEKSLTQIFKWNIYDNWLRMSISTNNASRVSFICEDDITDLCY